MNILIILIISSNVFLYAQLIPISYNLNNKELMNIAAPNGDNIKYPFKTYHELILMHRTQWTGLSQAPKWSGISYSYTLDERASTGGSLYLESFGAVRSYFLSGNYKYDINLDNKSILAGGSIIRYNLNQLNTSRSDVRDPGDPLIVNSNSSSSLSFSPGICFSKTIPDPDIYFVLGASFQNLISINFSKNDFATPLKVIILHGSWMWFLSPGYKNVSSIEVGGVFRRHHKTSDDIHLYGKYNWKGLLALRPGIRFGTLNGIKMHAMHMDLGIPLGNLIGSNSIALDLNYVYEFPFIANTTDFGSTHEISLIALF